MTAESSPASKPLPKRLNHIQALRGIAAVMVVISHLLIIERKYSPDQILGDWAVYGMAGVDLFFAISGFIMVYVMWDRPRGIKAAGQFLWGRASRIYPLYWIVSLVLLGLWFLRPDMVFSSIEAPPDIFKSFALLPQDREPLLAVGWTLVHEVYFYLVFAGIMLLPRRALMPCLIGWALLIAAFHIYHIRGAGPNSPAVKLITSAMTIQFILGAVLGWALKTGDNFASKSSLPARPKLETMASLVFIALGVLTLWSALSDRLINFPSDSARGWFLAMPCGLIVYGLARLDVAGKKIWKPLVILGDWSYSLYLTHVLSLTVMGRIWARFSGEGLAGNAAVLIIMIAVTIIVSGLVYKYIEAPIIKAARSFKKT